MTGVIYVAQGAKILKVGRTINLESRKRSIYKEFSRFSDEVTSFRSFPAHGREGAAETSLLYSIKETHKPYMGREWFMAGDFEQVCAEAEKACAYVKTLPSFNFKPISKKERLRLENERKERLIREAQQRADHKIKREQQSRQKKLIRVLRAIELDCIAMWKRIQPKAVA